MRKMPMEETTIGTLARFTGVSSHTIKYYEKIGLFRANRKEQSNYRSYGLRACTDIYECVKYKNLGFSLKEIGILHGEADDDRLKQMLAKRLEEVEEEIRKACVLRDCIREYSKELEMLDEHLDEWYLERCPDFYFRRQSENLEYLDDGCMESDGINLIDYAPRSKDVVKIAPEYLNGKAVRFSWGQGICIREGETWMQDRKGFEHISARRAFVTYMRVTGPYVSQGEMIEKIRRIYGEYRETFETSAYAIRIKITYDEEGRDWNYFKIVIPDPE